MTLLSNFLVIMIVSNVLRMTHEDEEELVHSVIHHSSEILLEISTSHEIIGNEQKDSVIVLESLSL